MKNCSQQRRSLNTN